MFWRWFCSKTPENSLILEKKEKVVINNPKINRKQYCELLLGNLTVSSTNQEVITHLISIMPQLIEITIIQTEFAELLNVNVLKDIERSDNLQQSVCAMTSHDYYEALACLSDYLLRHRTQDDPLDFVEIHIIYIFVNCILNNKL